MLTWKDNIISEQFVEQSKDHHHFVAKIPGIHTLHCTENTSYSISIRSMKSQYRLQLTDVTRCVPYPTEWWCLATSRGYYTYQLLSTQGLTLNILCVLGICSYSFSKQIHVVIWQKINSLKKGKKKRLWNIEMLGRRKSQTESLQSVTKSMISLQFCWNLQMGTEITRWILWGEEGKKTTHIETSSKTVEVSSSSTWKITRIETVFFSTLLF